MNHICDETKLVFVKQEGTLLTYRCPDCGKEFGELGSIVIHNSLPIKRCKVYIQWSNIVPLANQINTLKKIAPDIKSIKNSELLKVARSNTQWEIGEMYASEGYELAEKAATKGLLLVVDLIDYEV